MTDPLALQRRALRDFLRWLGDASEGASTWAAPGVLAAIVPATPERSIVNSVTFDEPADLERAYDGLVAAYRAAGVAAWTVWAPDVQPEAIDFLTARGHAFDGKPTAMDLALDSFEPPDLGVLEWDSRGSFSDLGRINDRVYGLGPDDGMAPAIAGPPSGASMRIYRALAGGSTASVLATMDHEDDLGVYFVATAEEHMRKGLAGRLLAAALVEGRERGMRTSSLQSSAKGRPVYERLGYRPRFALHLYERRG